MVRPVQCEKELSATAKRVFSSGGLNLDGVVRVEVDQLHLLLGVCRQGYRFCQEKASLEGLMTGATDVSKPVGSAEIIHVIF